MALQVLLRPLSHNLPSLSSSTTTNTMIFVRINYICYYLTAVLQLLPYKVGLVGTSVEFQMGLAKQQPIHFLSQASFHLYYSIQCRRRVKANANMSVCYTQEQQMRIATLCHRQGHRRIWVGEEQCQVEQNHLAKSLIIEVPQAPPHTPPTSFKRLCTRFGSSTKERVSICGLYPGVPTTSSLDKEPSSDWGKRSDHKQMKFKLRFSVKPLTTNRKK